MNPLGIAGSVRLSTRRVGFSLRDRSGVARAESRARTGRGLRCPRDPELAPSLGSGRGAARPAASDLSGRVFLNNISANICIGFEILI
ncbi:protein of unassigned function [Methylobacterium oryzae CBMB20]|uniref:Protein of unassigned function n=1 Tax=Methylobacterium oryzae CBMB20 TaxID=693986 RepID=A0A089QCL9_9HYPH|nr:protein of unassigned function [Methylobacterium oryzae CBMB20]